jgi:hypothetical protein
MGLNPMEQKRTMSLPLFGVPRLRGGERLRRPVRLKAELQTAGMAMKPEFSS